MSVFTALVSCVPVADQVPLPAGMRAFFTPIHGPLGSKAVRKLFTWLATQCDCSPTIIVLEVPSEISEKRRATLPGKIPPPEQWPPLGPLRSVESWLLLPAIKTYEPTINCAPFTSRNRGMI